MIIMYDKKYIVVRVAASGMTGAGPAAAVAAFKNVVLTTEKHPEEPNRMALAIRS